MSRIQQPDLEIKIRSETELVELLNQHKIDHREWLKTPLELFQEIQSGESKLIIDGQLLIYPNPHQLLN